MIKLYENVNNSKWQQLLQRPLIDDSKIGSQVFSIINDVKDKGDDALFKLTEKFDGVKLNDLKVSKKEILLACDRVENKVKIAIRNAIKNIKKFHESQEIKNDKIETQSGVVCWRESRPIEKVGLYIPSGTAPLFSTLIMLAIPAKIAGCREIVICTPSSNKGIVDDHILFVASEIGIDTIFKVGGAQAIAAMAYGTESIPKVYKIFGPGNQYVNKAKELVNNNFTSIDMPAGPSELVVIADDKADPSFVAADLLSQAEHGEDSQVVLLSTSKDLVINVQSELKKQIEELPRKEICKKSLKNSFALVVDLKKIIEFSNEYAPEHLIINTKNYNELVIKIVNAGSVFLGPYSSESAGDYASGTNHTLPTNSYSKIYSGLSLDSFMKSITFQEISEEGHKNLADTIEIMAEKEGLIAHKNASTIRRTK